jgi:hypothetical protein
MGTVVLLSDYKLIAYSSPAHAYFTRPTWLRIHCAAAPFRSLSTNIIPDLPIPQYRLPVTLTRYSLSWL